MVNLELINQPSSIVSQNNSEGQNHWVKNGSKPGQVWQSTNWKNIPGTSSLILNPHSHSQVCLCFVGSACNSALDVHLGGYHLECQLSPTPKEPIYSPNMKWKVMKPAQSGVFTYMHRLLSSSCMLFLGHCFDRCG